MSSQLHSTFTTAGELIVTGGNTPFLLDDPESVWLVEAGQVEVFSVRVEAGQPAGNRYHFFSVTAGQLLLGIGSSARALGRGLLAVGMVNTRLRKLPLARLRELAARPELRDDLAQAMDAWIVGLSLGVSRDVNPRTELMLEPAGKIEIPASARFRSKRGVLWITHFTGDLLFIGMEDVALMGEPACFPLSQDTWLQALGPATVGASATRDVIGEDALWNGLSVLHDTLLRCEAVNKRLAEVDDYNRLKSRAEAGERASKKAMEQLAAVMREEAPEPAAKVSDPLFLACQIAAGHAGIGLVPPPELLRGQQARDPLGAIVRASRLRTRAVTFKPGWGHEAAGPFLGFLAQPRQPVALLPLGGGGYELVNPADGTRRMLDDGLAALLEPGGHAFYRSFTDEAFSTWELLRFGARGLRKDFLLLCLMGIAGGLLATLPAMAIGQVFDSIVPEAEQLKLLQITAGLVVLAITAGIFDFTRGIASLRIEGRLDQELQAALIDRLLKLPVPFFRDYSSGDLAERAMSLNQIRLVISNTMVNAVLGNAFAGFNLVLLFYYDAKLAAAAVATLAVALGFTLVTGLLQLGDERQVAAVQGKLTGMVLQFLTGITKLRVAGAEPLAFSAWAGQFARQKDLAFRARRLMNRLHVFNAAFPVLSSAILFHLVTRWSGANPMSTGDFLAFTAAFSGFGAPMMVMTAAALSALNVVPLFDRLRPLLQARPEVTDAKLDPGQLSGEIELSHLSFRYSPDSPLVLHDVSLHARPGEFIAIVGPSGSGKSTLIRLLLGFDTPENGVIHFDGQNLAELDVAAVRRQIGVVMQSSKLMAGSILTNIIGSSLLTEEDAWRAARLAGLAEDIEAMPMGMYTVIPAGGGVLSGGQQQRLMIARAIVFQPRILLFDEATSALDNRTQAVVSESLEKLQATRLVIAHRLSTIVNADRIFVVEAGRIVQHGTYQELLQQPGLFSELARRQLLDQGEVDGQAFLY